MTTALLVAPAAVAGAESVTGPGAVRSSLTTEAARRVAVQAESTTGAAPARAEGAPAQAETGAVLTGGVIGARSGGVTGTAASRQDTQVVVNSITPQVPRDSTTPIKISGYVANTGQDLLSSVSVQLRFSGQPFATRADMQAFADGGQIIDRSRMSIPVSQLVASGKVAWEFPPITAGQLGMFRFGVYPVTVALVDLTGRQLTAQRTFLPYAPKDQTVTPTKISWALPIVDQPHRGDDATFVDDGLGKVLADDGRLGKILKIAETPSKGVSWFVDPAVLDDAQAMAKGYSLISGTTATTKPADQTAVEWLRRLRDALTDVPVSATPYADPDVEAASHHGLDSTTDIALDKGAAVATQLLGKDVGTTTNWPVNGVIDHDALDVLAVGDVRTVLLSSAALPPNPPVTYTPDAVTSLDTVRRPVKVLLSDPVLSQILTTDGASAPDAALMATQRFLAETVMISAERAGEPRTVIAAPPRRWNPDPAFVSALLKAAASAPWLKPVTLGSIKPSKAPPVPRADLVYTDKDKQAELGRSYVTAVRKLGIRAEMTATVTNDHVRVFDTALLRLTSSAWRGHTGSATPLLKQIDSTVTARTGAISVTTGEQRTIAGKNGVVPISIHNSLRDQDVTVGIKITSGDRKLKIGTYESLVTVSRSKTKPIDIPMVATKGGETKVKVQLTTAEGVRYGNPSWVTVTTTGYTDIALVIVGAALTVMLAAVMLRVFRRRSRRAAKNRKAVRSAPTAAPEPAQHREGPS